MTESNDRDRAIEQRLETWGSEAPPAVDGAFANRLDARLRDLADGRAAGRPRPIWQPLAVAAVILLAVGIGGFSLLRSGDDDLLLVLGAASGTEIVLPGGEIVAAEEGLELVEGTRISVGSGGSAVVGDVVLESGTDAVVNDGRLEILVDDPTGSEAPSDRTTTTRPVTDDPSPTTRPTSPSTETTSPTTTQRSTTTSPDRPSTTAGDVTAPSTAPASSTTTSVLDSSVELTAAATREGRVRLTWTYVGPDSLGGWEVTVANGDRTRTLAVLRDPAARSITVEESEVPVSYRVVARTSEGGFLAESALVAAP